MCAQVMIHLVCVPGIRSDSELVRPTIIVPENSEHNRLSLCVETHTRILLLSFCSTAAGRCVLACVVSLWSTRRYYSMYIPGAVVMVLLLYCG